MKKNTIQANINADPRGFKKGIKDAIGEIEVFGVSVEDLKGKLGLLAGAAAIGAAVKALWDMASQLAKTADRLFDLQDITGISTEKLQQYEHVARVAGVSSETMATAIQGLTQRMARGGEEAGPLVAGLAQLGLSIRDVSGNIRNGGDVMEEVIGKLSEMENITERNVLGARIFGGAWRELAPVLSLGRDGINAAMKEAKELGLVLDGETLRAAENFRVEMETLSAQMQAFKHDVATVAIPTFQWIIKTLHESVRGWKYLFGAMGDVNDQVYGDVKSHTDEIIRSIDHITDSETRRAAIMGKQLWYHNKARELWAEEDKMLQKLGDRYADISRTILANFDDYATMKEREAAAAQAAADEEAARAAAAAELAAQAERDRRAALGEIGRMQEDITKAEAAFIAANSDAERQQWLRRRTDLEIEMEMLKERNALELGAQEADRRGLAAGLTPMPGLVPGGTMLDTGHDEFLQQQAEKQIALRQTEQQIEQTEQAAIDMSGAMLDSAFAVGKAFGDMAADSGKSTDEIVQDLLRQVVGAIIKSLVTGLPFPANLIAAAGAGALASSLFNQVPRFARGTDYAPGGMAWVGERGPELVNLPRGSQVFSNHESMNMGGRVVFEISGRKLRGILDSENSRLNQIG